LRWKGHKRKKKGELKRYCVKRSDERESIKAGSPITTPRREDEQRIYEIFWCMPLKKTSISKQSKTRKQEKGHRGIGCTGEVLRSSNGRSEGKEYGDT